MLIDSVIYFTAPWCGPCKTFKPVFRKAMEEKGVDFLEIDIDKEPLLAEANKVMSVPSVIFLGHEAGGSRYQAVEVDRIVGAFPEPLLRKRLDTLFG